VVDLGSNGFITALPAAARASLEARAEGIAFASGQEIYSRDDSLAQVFFPLSCVVGVNTSADDGSSTLLAVCGPEGVLGLPGVISGMTTSASAKVVVEGFAARLPATVLGQLFDTDPAVRRLILHYIQALVAQVGETAHCIGHHSIEQRLSLLLLRVSDRVRARRASVLLTHEFLAELLSVRRETVSTAARELQRRGLIDYHRGHLTMLDLEGLSERACTCYQKIGAVYTCLLNPHFP
jgi:CRP-like cAMP-binding protein